ncbi:MAG: DEAD/DEAH box helicase family protein [Gemmatimonadota bacterium]|uniref:DEAD/DEAH box helicase n=1 Tax=Candidatus Palauibacter scopulicola TaxID=3056741 RepID=UPI00228F8C65|nr:DEAD/DEAH box helicase family protein [Gemmatimonadota bacterium]MDE0615591.1 DEAD/DEAH box helicase family protein [bacterium]MDE2663770.1 DEAD/DEAH box helicase family protein [Candidatus Palauibacter scopulicola]
MRFRRLEYQDRVLATLDAYIDHLRTEKRKSDAIRELADSREELGLAVPDFTEKAWAGMESQGKLPSSRNSVPFSPRTDGCGDPVPNVVLKVPTGGGKTWLAVSGVSSILGRYLERNTGFVLWIVPNEAIYRQTLGHLRDREHPYRQALDRAAAGRVRVMEKGDRLDVRDVRSNLCVMLLMLQAANRETKESLRMFRDRGNVHGFFPPEGDQQAHRRALERTGNLDAYGGRLFPMVKDSLGNALRVIRPVVVMDEGHRAISDLAFRTLYGFNPCFVLELTATPKDVRPRGGRNPRHGRYANLLVEVTGRELDREGMIKIPLNLEPRHGTDWHATLNAAVTRLNALHEEARKYRSDTNRYIRPIMLVQVERTGKDQRDSGRIHANDVKDWLLTAGFDEAEIAIKTAEQNDLNQPENQDLLSPTNRVRAIITKQALQEGWDCPFAYVLCALAASSNLSAMTQLVGRILRQPGAIRTGVKALDECHIITHHAETESVVEAIKRGLERDGLGDLQPHVDLDDDASGHGLRKISRRPAFSSTEIYLPKVMVTDGDQVRELDYGTDVLSRIDWRDFDPKGIADLIPENARSADTQLRRVSLRDGDRDPFHDETVAESGEILALDPVHAARMILDIVPNPFVGRSIVGRLLTRLRERGFDNMTLGGIARLIVEELRKGLDGERNARAEALFKRAVAAGDIQFRLRLDGRNWRMPVEIETTEAPDARQLVSGDGGPLQRSLFAPVYESEFNRAEREVAVYLDGEETLTWWHRNVARTQYGIQGWRRGRIYPDFIFAVPADGAGGRIVVLETKGDHLDNPGDTAYKREVLSFLSSSFAWDDYTPAGELELVVNDGVTVQCALILMSEWRTKLPNFLSVEAP